MTADNGTTFAEPLWSRSDEHCVLPYTYTVASPRYTVLSIYTVDIQTPKRSREQEPGR